MQYKNSNYIEQIGSRKWQNKAKQSTTESR